MKRISGSPSLPITLTPGPGDPMHRQIYDWFQRAIVSGQLTPRQRVPSTRMLATELGISRIPVLQAFDQLKAEGYLQTFAGSGTCVSGSIPQERIGRASAMIRTSLHKRGARKIGRPSLPRKTTREPWLDLSGAFRMHLPALDHFPTDIWSHLVARNARKRTSELMVYGDQRGYGPFREVIAQYLRVARGVRCDPGQVMVVSGSQFALHLSARVLLNAGEAVWMEEPGYPGAHQAFAASCCRLIPVPIDAEGLDVQQGVRLCRRARAAYVTPSHQYPLGATMSVTRRIQLLDWARRNDAWIIEDDYDSELRHRGRPIPSLQGLDSDARVIYVGTFSKALFPALRVGYLVVPADLMGAFSIARDATDIFPPTLAQAVLADFIQEGHFARHLRRMRVLYAQRCEALVEALRARIGHGLEIMNGEAGMHLVALLPRGLQDVSVSRNAAQRGLAAMPLSNCCLTRFARKGLVLGYGTIDRAQIERGVHQLKLTLDAQMRLRTVR